MLDVNRMVDAVLSAVGAPILALAKRVAALEERAPKDGAEGPRGEPGPAGPPGPPGDDADHWIELERRLAELEAKATQKLIASTLAEYDAALTAPTRMAKAVADYLKANPPAAGKDGADGIDGKDGAPGADGKKGVDGKDGVGLAGALIGMDGNLAVTLTDGGIRALGAVVGRDGAPGPKGEAGDRGEQGMPGDRGEKGERGIDGKDGAPAPGISAEMSLAPDDVAEQVAKAMTLLAESPTVAAKGSSVVLNINSARDDRLQKSTKTITTRRDKDGNLVADVVENRG